LETVRKARRWPSAWTWTIAGATITYS